jgi:uncharacterized membrane protein YdjX (TVP38/TMEM64 family)
MVARFFGREAVESILKGRLKSWDEKATQKGLWAVLVVRFVGIPPFIVSNYALGLSGVKTRDYVAGTFLGILPWMALITLAANSLWEAVKAGGEHGLTKAVGVHMAPFMLLSLVLLLWVIGSQRRTRKEAHVYELSHQDRPEVERKAA